LLNKPKRTQTNCRKQFLGLAPSNAGRNVLLLRQAFHIKPRFSTLDTKVDCEWLSESLTTLTFVQVETSQVELFACVQGCGANKKGVRTYPKN